MSFESSVSLQLARKYLGEKVEVVIDRPVGALHPTRHYVYEVNYGFVSGAKAPDGEDLDAYYLGSNEPLDTATGECIAIIHRVDDDDDKLVVVPDGVYFTDDEIMKMVFFQERWFTSTVIR